MNLAFFRRVGNRMIQLVFIVKQDGNTPMLLKELAVAHHFTHTISLKRKSVENNDLW